MMTTDEKVCLLLSTLEFTASSKIQHFLDLFETTGDVWTQLNDMSERATQILGESDFARIKYSLNDRFIELTLNDLQGKGIIPVTRYSQYYPKRLLETADPPLTLYCQGDLTLFNDDSLAVIGTRKLSAYGKRVTESFSRELASQFVIVSGLAYGADSVAHRATLDVQGKTIAVLGSGLLNIYPSSNTALAREIVSKGGLLVSEFTPYCKANNYHFPMRNRIVAGISLGILITEAPSKSGVFSTLEYALEQGKEVFVVPGEIYAATSKGSNDILKRIQGACVTEPKDVYDAMSVKYNILKKAKIQLDFTQQLVVDLLDGGKKNFDELVALSGIKPSELNYVLANLELMGVLMKLPNNYYQYTAEA